MLTVKITTHHGRREITAVASDSRYGDLASETRTGTGSRAKSALEVEVRRLGEQQLSALNRAGAVQAAAGSITETRLIGQRL
ncbi:hypothetical protein D0N36_06790 [Hymenobacter lapidiphilus]|uniref:hypothetical protein n=1 Tax=Hymenobacter sp. CCM 8763 TaxID=2303334 RepID=UPI000E345A9D|nr:hypothetical protein [Hymenobacter sp. CCM 8763]RFP65904.1 hypothetical protein D0N36_06790 [Hymenobacter sp. CCM 8763]